jgi:hypothetical protein
MALHYLTIPSVMITFVMMKLESTGNKGKLRALTFEEAEEERLNYTLRKSIRERLEYLQRLRILNYGEKATQPIVRKIRVLEGTKKK